jgi:hypothetical protein
VNEEDMQQVKGGVRSGQNKWIDPDIDPMKK